MIVHYNLHLGTLHNNFNFVTSYFNAMKIFYHFLLVAILFASSSVNAQTFVPMPCTGYNIDGVAENTTAVSSTGGPIDASDFVLYSNFYGTLYGGGAVGLPNNGLVAAGTRTYQLMSYTGNNVLHLVANAADTLVFTNPQAFPAISLLCFGTQGNATASVTVRFTDNTTEVFPALALTDWFSVVSPVYAGFDRAARTSGAPALVGAAGNPRMMGLDLPLLCTNRGKPIAKIIVRNVSTSSRVCIMAVSGQVPAYSVTGNQNICAAAGTTLTATGFATYTWQAVSNFAGSNSASVALTPTANTTYTLLGTDALGCPGYTAVAVIVSTASPILSLAGTTQSICLGAAATVSASGALNYTLSSPAANGASFVPTSSAVYTIQGSNGCGVATATTAITVSPLTITATSNNTLVCSGNITTLTANGATNYTWMPGTGTQSLFTPSPLATTIYTLSGRTSSCNATATIAITTKPLPTLSIVASNSTVCAGDVVTLTVSGNAQTYTWTPGSQTTTTYTLAPTSNTLISASGTSSLNCIGNAQQVIVVYALPVLTLTASKYTVCSGGSSTLNVSGAVTYTWNSGSIAPTVTVNPISTQVYTVTGTNSNSCIASSTLQVAAITASVAINSSTSICAGGSATLSASGASSYTWANNNFGFASFAASPSITTIYTVNATVSYTPASLLCSATNTTQVTVNPQPTLTVSSTRSVICKGEKSVLTASASNAGMSYVWTTGSATLSGGTQTVNPTTTVFYSLSGTDANGCTNTLQYQLKVNTCGGIAEAADVEKGIRLYPNPANAEVYVLADIATDVVLINALGEVIKEMAINQASAMRINLEQLPAGVYYITEKHEGKLQAKKLVVTH